MPVLEALEVPKAFSSTNLAFLTLSPLNRPKLAKWKQTATPEPAKTGRLKTLFWSFLSSPKRSYGLNKLLR